MHIGHGMDVCGVPVGDTTFVRAFLEGKVNDAMSKANNVSRQLRDVHLQSLWSALLKPLSFFMELEIKQLQLKN